MKTKRLWCIFYRIRVSSNSKWCKWVGPCGIGILSSHSIFIGPELINALQGRPFFIRTRKQARAIAKEINEKSNITWTWVQYTVRPVKITYEVL